MAREVNFEVQVNQNGRWEIHARHDNAADATEEAKSLDVLPSIDEVKVVRDTYDPDTGDSRETIVYRSPKGQAAYKTALPENEFNLTGRAASRRAADNGSDLDFDQFGNSGRSAKNRGPAKPQTFTGTLIKILLIILFGVSIAGLLAFGSIMFLRDTSFSNNVQTNIVFVIFVVAFLVSTFVLALNFLKSDSIGSSPLPVPRPRPSAPPPAGKKPAKKPAPTPKKTEKSSTDKVVLGAPPTEEGLNSEAGLYETPDPNAEEEEEFAEMPELPEQPAPEPEPESESENEVAEPDDLANLPDHAARQRLSLMTFLTESLEAMERDTSQLDNFNKFGISMYLAGSTEALGQKTMLDIRSASQILAETVTMIGFRKSEAVKFADKYEEYLLTDSRYMQMFQAGRNAMSTYMEEDPDAIKYLDQALAEWNKPKAKEGPVSTVTVLFTDIAGSTAMTQELGDAVAQQIVRAHNRIVREALTDFNGKEIKHTGDGIMASFDAVSSSVEAAIRIQQKVTVHTEFNPDLPLYVKIGINAGEPIAEENDLFGSTVQMAARIVDKAAKKEIFVSEIVRGICQGKPLRFKSRGEFEMKGFDTPPTLYEALWDEE